MILIRIVQANDSLPKMKFNFENAPVYIIKTTLLHIQG